MARKLGEEHFRPQARGPGFRVVGFLLKGSIAVLWGLGFRAIGFRVIWFRVIGFRVIGFRV